MKKLPNCKKKMLHHTLAEKKKNPHSNLKQKKAPMPH